MGAVTSPRPAPGSYVPQVRIFNEVNVLLRAEVLRQGYAVEVVADLTFVHGNDVEEDDERAEDDARGEEADPDEGDLLGPVVRAERDERQERVRQQEPEDEAEEMRVVVDPREQSEQKQDQDDAQQLH